MITRHEAYKDLAKALQINSLLFKREDLHPYGSHKGRSIPVMIDTYIKQGFKNFAISSSGNAGLAAAHHIQKINKENNNIKLDILLGLHTNKIKLDKIEKFRDQNISITIHERPLQTLFNKTQDNNIKALRQSNDDTALIGYAELADELLEIKDIEAVFIGTSSGTTAQALIENFQKYNRNVEIHMVQTSSCHPISDAFVDDETNDELSIADAIVDHTAIRKDKIVKLIIDKTCGSAWIASNEQIRVAQELTKKYTGLSISTNSALSVAGLMQAVYTGRVWNGSVVCMICGD